MPETARVPHRVEARDVSSSHCSPNAPKQNGAVIVPSLKISVLGCGSMGAGIAELALAQGFEVTLWNHRETTLHSARAQIQKSLAKRARVRFPDDTPKQQAFVNDWLAKLRTTVDVVHSAKDADLIIESVIESLPTKQKLFNILDQHAPEHCIFATNTSGLSVGEIGSVMSPERRSKFAGLHFFNPVSSMKLVELVHTSETSDATSRILSDFARSIGKVPVRCRDTPGFIVNRLLLPYILNCFAMLERGDATAEGIDTAMRLGAGHPLGPFQLADMVGLDIIKTLTDDWRKRINNGEKTIHSREVRAARMIEDLVVEGKVGMKVGEGVYKHSARTQAKL